jgi:hypothetical protein
VRTAPPAKRKRTAHTAGGRTAPPAPQTASAESTRTRTKLAEFTESLKPRRRKRDGHFIERQTASAESTRMRTKLAEFTETLRLKPRCRKRDGHFIEMQCVGCHRWLERTTENFNKEHGGTNFATCLPGHETLHNSKSNPCKTCFAAITSERHNTPDGYVRALCSPYPTITPAQVWAEYERLDGLSALTGVRMVLTPNAPNRVSIHNRDQSDKNHAHWTLDVLETNLWKRGDAIPCLRQAWTDVYTRLNDMFTGGGGGTVPAFAANFASTPRQNGVTAGRSSNTLEYYRQMRDKHLPYILGKALNDHYRKDVEVTPRMDPAPDPTQFKHDLKHHILDRILAQKGRCFVSGIPLTIHNGWTHFSLKRLDNTKARFNPDGTLPATSVLVCRLFNAPDTIDRTKLLTYYLRQKLVPVPCVARARAQQELDDIAQNAEAN